MKAYKRDMIVLFVFMVLSALVYFVFIPAQIRLPAKTDISFTNRTFPQFTMAVIFLASTCGFLDALKKFVREKKAASPEKEQAAVKADILEELRPLLGFALILLYALAFHYISLAWRGYGFLIATALFIPAFLAFLRCKKWQYYLAVYAFAGIMFVIFKYVLHILFR